MPTTPDALKLAAEADAEFTTAWNDLPDSLRCHPGLKRVHQLVVRMRDQQHATLESLRSELLAQSDEARQMADVIAAAAGREAALRAEVESLRAGRAVPERRLIGWRTENFLWETDDPDKARNWEPNIGVLPIFEGDQNTKLAAPTPPQASQVGRAVPDGARGMERVCCAQCPPGYVVCETCEANGISEEDAEQFGITRVINDLAAPTPSQVAPDDWTQPHPPSWHCMCPSCIPSFDDRFKPPAHPAQQPDDARDAALTIAKDALDEIALAGMSGTGQESEEAIRDWHARQAWKFIGVAARAKSAIDAALSAQEQGGHHG